MKFIAIFLLLTGLVHGQYRNYSEYGISRNDFKQAVEFDKRALYYKKKHDETQYEKNREKALFFYRNSLNFTRSVEVKSYILTRIGMLEKDFTKTQSLEKAIMLIEDELALKIKNSDSYLENAKLLAFLWKEYGMSLLLDAHNTPLCEKALSKSVETYKMLDMKYEALNSFQLLKQYCPDSLFIKNWEYDSFLFAPAVK